MTDAERNLFILRSQRKRDARKQAMREKFEEVKEASGSADAYDMQDAFVVASSIDDVLQEKTIDGPQTASIRNLTDKMRAANALPIPQEAGTRVRFVANLGSILTYPEVPGDGLIGTVVTVKTADGNVTSHEGKVFVLWDDGKFRPIFAEHLRFAKTPNKQASSFRRVVADLGDLSGFFMQASSRDELVHKSTKDLWAVKKNGDGYVIERLFNEDGEPLKV